MTQIKRVEATQELKLAIGHAMAAMHVVATENGSKPMDAIDLTRLQTLGGLLTQLCAWDDQTIVQVYEGESQQPFYTGPLSSACQAYGDHSEVRAAVRDKLIKTGKARVRCQGRWYRLVCED